MNRVLVFGGTHGNEWTGAALVKNEDQHWKKDFPKLNLELVLANPKAFSLCRRFQDEDLNRAFQFLHENRETSYEHNRAKEIKAMIEEAACFVIDLHTTTSAMGNTVIITRETPLNFRIAKSLTKALPETRVIFSPDPQKKYLVSQSEWGLMIEVGPVANGVVEPKTYEATKALLREVLVGLSTPENLTPGELEIFEEKEDVHYPLGASGQMSAYIHPDLQGRDFSPIKGKYKAFRGFDSTDLERETLEEMYPIFINEAAYYPAKLAYTLCKKKKIKI